MNLAYVALALLLFSMPAAATPEQDAALKEIESFTALQTRTDPLYPRVETELLKEMEEILKRPAPEWASTIKRRYFSLSEKAHGAERAEVRQQEAAALGALAGSNDTKWLARMGTLEKVIQDGKLSPREHALHALEAAKLLFPDDGPLLGLRERKLSLATAYETGQITRAEYDERWSRARADAKQQIDRMDATRAQDAAIVNATANARAGATVSNWIRRSMTCTSSPSATGSTTTCR